MKSVRKSGIVINHPALFLRPCRFRPNVLPSSSNSSRSSLASPNLATLLANAHVFLRFQSTPLSPSSLWTGGSQSSAWPGVGPSGCSCTSATLSSHFGPSTAAKSTLLSHAKRNVTETISSKQHRAAPAWCGNAYCTIRAAQQHSLCASELHTVHSYGKIHSRPFSPLVTILPPIRRSGD